MRPGNALAVVVTVLSLSSAAAAQQVVRVREAGRLGIGVGAGLPVPPFGASAHARVEGFVSKRLVLIAEGRVGYIGAMFTSLTSASADLTAAFIPGRTLFLRGGAGVRMVEGTTRRDSSSDEISPEEHRIVDLVLSAGNRWDWQYSFIEFDWLGIRAPLSASSSTTDPKHEIDGAPWEVRSSVTFGVAF